MIQKAEGRKAAQRGIGGAVPVWNAVRTLPDRRMFDSLLSTRFLPCLRHGGPVRFAESPCGRSCARRSLLISASASRTGTPLPRRIAQEEIRETFREGLVHPTTSARRSRGERPSRPEGHHAWFASITRRDRRAAGNVPVAWSYQTSPVSLLPRPPQISGKHNIQAINQFIPHQMPLKRGYGTLLSACNCA